MRTLFNFWGEYSRGATYKGLVGPATYNGSLSPAPCPTHISGQSCEMEMIRPLIIAGGLISAAVVGFGVPMMRWLGGGPRPG